MRKLLVLSCLFFNTFFYLYSATAVWKCQDYDLRVFYTNETNPGDAIFIRMIFSPKGIYKKELKSSKGIVEFYSNNDPHKKISESIFFLSNNSSKKFKKMDILIAGIPLSTYQKNGDYTAKIVFSAFNRIYETFSLPIKINSKNFIKEVIELDTKNTAIKTDSSKQRYNQINTLNSILETTNHDSTFQTDAFICPTTSKRITSFFGDRRIYSYSNGKSSTSLHYGIDYGIPTGTEVKASGTGKVVMAENRVSTGWSICIEHLPGLYSLYYHLDKLNVKIGQIVKKEELIGMSGSTGLATGPHLHWEVRLNTVAVNPDFFTTDFTFQQEQENLLR